MDADTNLSQSSPASANDDATTDSDSAAAGFPIMQVQKSFNLTRTTSDKELVNTLNIRDYFFFSV